MQLIIGLIAKSAIAHQKGGRLKDAMRCYTRALQLNSLDIDALVGRGTLHTKMYA
jgi:hypothetical protein